LLPALKVSIVGLASQLPLLGSLEKDIKQIKAWPSIPMAAKKGSVYGVFMRSPSSLPMCVLPRREKAQAQIASHAEPVTFHDANIRYGGVMYS